MKIRVLMVDDHALFRDGMHYVLRQLADEVEVLDTGDIDEAFRLAEANPDIDLVLLDLNMPGSYGIPTAASFHQNFPSLPLVIVSGIDQPDDIERVIEIGAMGFISKMSAGKVMLSALRLVLDGEIYVPTQILGKHAGIGEPRSRCDGRLTRDCATGMTGRQLEVFKLAALGFSNKEIGLDLGVAESTIKVHLAAAYQTLHVKSRAEAIQAAQQLGIV
jgi:DNA-binding NarL/FixJ family response regulator